MAFIFNNDLSKATSSLAIDNTTLDYGYFVNSDGTLTSVNIDYLFNKKDVTITCYQKLTKTSAMIGALLGTFPDEIDKTGVFQLTIYGEKGTDEDGLYTTMQSVFAKQEITALDSHLTYERYYDKDELTWSDWALVPRAVVSTTEIEEGDDLESGVVYYQIEGE